MTYYECMARLMACPALPRGERLAWALNLDGSRGEPWHSDGAMWGRCFKHAKYRFKETERFWREAASMASTLSTHAHQAGCDRWRSVAAPLRRAREERQKWKRRALELAPLMGEVHRLQCQGVFSLERDPFDLIPAIDAYAAEEISGGKIREYIRRWLAGESFRRSGTLDHESVIPAAFARLKDGE